MYLNEIGLTNHLIYQMFQSLIETAIALDTQMWCISFCDYMRLTGQLFRRQPLKYPRLSCYPTQERTRI